MLLDHSNQLPWNPIKNHPFKASFTAGEDDEGRYETMERIREVAKQARIIIGEVYGQGVMDTFSADLTCLDAKRGCPEKLPVDEVWYLTWGGHVFRK